jgi:lipopolysaccharide export system protein LptA
MFFCRIALSLGLSVFLFAGAPAMAQSAQPAAGGFAYDATQPLEVSADSLRLDQDAGTAIFEGAVQVSQGEFYLQADHIEVFYGQAEDTGANEITRLVATGNVKLVSGAEKAEAQSANFDVAEGNIRMQGDVLLTQGNNLISGDVAIINLDDGSARVEGRVRTVLQPGEAKE